MDNRLTKANFLQLIGAYGCPAKLHISKHLKIQAAMLIECFNCKTEIVILPITEICAPDGSLKLPWRAEFANGGTIEGDGTSF